MIKELTNLQALEQVSGGAVSFRRVTVVSNGTTTTTTTSSGGSNSGSSSFGSDARARFEARRAAFRQRTASSANGDRQVNVSSENESVTAGSRRGFPASAALGLP